MYCWLRNTHQCREFSFCFILDKKIRNKIPIFFWKLINDVHYIFNFFIDIKSIILIITISNFIYKRCIIII